MAQICNKIAEELAETQFRAKGAAARAATIAVLGAVSDCYKAAEALHANNTVGPPRVYLDCASTKLAAAEVGFVRNREILRSVQPRAEALEWLRSLDYDRLYDEGVRDRTIPANIAQWSRLADINRSRGYLGVADHLIGDVRELRHDVDAVAAGLPEAPTDDVPVALVTMLVMLSNFAAFAQMVAYVNRLTPLDPSTTKEAPSLAGTGAVAT